MSAYKVSFKYPHEDKFTVLATGEETPMTEIFEEKRMTMLPNFGYSGFDGITEFEVFDLSGPEGRRELKITYRLSRV